LSKLPSVLFVSGLELASNDMTVEAGTGNLIFENKGDLPLLEEANLNITFTVGGFS
jgi:hypothetical protein